MIRLTKNTVFVLALALMVSACGWVGNSPTGPTEPTPVPVPTPIPEPTPLPIPPEPEPTPEPQPTLVSLTGTVRSITGMPLNAPVRILDGVNAGKSVATVNGAYRFDGLTAGNANVSAKAVGYEEVRAGVYIDGVNTLNFVLNPSVIDPNGSWVGSGTGIASDGTPVSVNIEFEVSSREVKTWVVRRNFSTGCNGVFTSNSIIPVVGNLFESNIKESKFAYTPTIKGTFSSSTTVAGVVTLVKNPILVEKGCPASATVNWTGTKK